jgi:hypothetical protein
VIRSSNRRTGREVEAPRSTISANPAQRPISYFRCTTISCI